VSRGLAIRESEGEEGGEVEKKKLGGHSHGKGNSREGGARAVREDERRSRAREGREVWDGTGTPKGGGGARVEQRKKRRGKEKGAGREGGGEFDRKDGMAEPKGGR